ncbi:MAG TPA: tetratricopeptide repeat protein [Verrucomicrobiae bacterium]|nr:tetratricopeptide repeat protein [Verrucomicrobiae bacterium]
MQTPTPRGLPPRIYLPVVIVFAVIFLGLVGYLVAQGFGVAGSLFGSAGAGGTSASGAQAGNTNVEGGPPPAVLEQLSALRKRVAAHPNDDVALTQLGDMYLTVAKYADAIAYYRRALHANPQNVAAKAGLAEATGGLASQGGT